MLFCMGVVVHLLYGKCIRSRLTQKVRKGGSLMHSLSARWHALFLDTEFVLFLGKPPPPLAPPAAGAGGGPDRGIGIFAQASVDGGDPPLDNDKVAPMSPRPGQWH